MAKGAAGSPRHLFAGRPAADAGHDPGVSAGCGACAEYLSPPVAFDSVGTEGTKCSGHLSPERLQAAVSELQPGVAGRGLRGLQGRSFLACSAKEMLSRAGRAPDFDDGSLRSPLAWH